MQIRVYSLHWAIIEYTSLQVKELYCILKEIHNYKQSVI